jgi:hypothetical protein
MPAPMGNRFWEQRSSHGRKPIFTTPDDLWSAAVEYFQWAEDNPLYEAKAFAYQGDVKVEKLPKMRAMTITGLCIFLDVSKRTWDAYREQEDFLLVATRVEDVIRTQKFEGASADLLNANIIARDLGLADKSELDVKGSLQTMSQEDLDARLTVLLGKAGTGPAAGGTGAAEEP